MLAATAQPQAATLSPASVMETAEGVAAYFMRTCPDVGADSYVGGKRRNSRIWTRGVFYEGLLNLYREQQRPEWLDYAVEWGEFHEWYTCTDSQRRHADFQCCGQAYLQMYMLDPERAERMEHIKMRIDDMMATDKVDDWYWVDAIQMAMPIFAMLGDITADEAYWERMYDMYAYTRNRHGGDRKGGGKPLFNEDTGLWYRDYQFDPPYKDKVETDKDCYWSRGNGWVYMALARVMQFTPATEAHRADYEADFRAMSRALLDCQRADGSWSVSLAAPSNYGAAGSEGPEDGGPITYDSTPDFEDFGIGCWLWGAAEVHALARQIEQDEATGITGTHVGNAAEAPLYDLQGRRILRPQPGRPYIRSGKVAIY